MRRISKVILLLLISVILISCGKKSYVVFDYNCNGTDYHKCEIKSNKLNCNISTPVCGEYRFKGWYRANEYNNPIDLNGTFNKNEIIYARWEKGGVVEPSSREEPTSTIVTPGIIDTPSSSSEMPSSSKEEPSSSQQQPVDPPKPEETYTISFNLNGGTGGQTTPISGVKYNNNLPSINQNKPTKPGYTFQGWYDNQNGGTQYYNSSNSPVRKYDKRSNTTLYAQWKINTLSIQYNGNGGTWANPSKDTYAVNSSNTVIVKSTNKVYQQQLNYGAKLESSGLVDYSGSWFKWTRSGYTVESKKEYIIGSTVIDQSKSYSAVELSRYAGCDLSKTDCTITVKVNWKINKLSIEYNGNEGLWKSSNSTYGVNSSNTVIVKSTNKVYQQQLNYGAKLESSGLVDCNGSWFNWTRSGYKVEDKKEYIIGSTVIDQNKVYSAVELSRYAGCDLSKSNCTITVKVNWVSSGPVQVHTPDPITDHVNVDSVNRAIANAVKSKGYYTREAVVAVAKTLISELNKGNYKVPYLLGGMYHRGDRWGVNPEWGTLVNKNNELRRSGLDCRNFVIWTFKQAGLSLIRGFGYEGSANGQYGNAYSDFKAGRPGDVIDAAEHIMLIISNNGDGYTVAQSQGSVGVILTTYKYSDLQPQRVRTGDIWYKAYNMDGMYNNNGYYCPSDSVYRPWPGSCHIPKSQFPSYYN